MPRSRLSPSVVHIHLDSRGSIPPRFLREAVQVHRLFEMPGWRAYLMALPAGSTLRLLCLYLEPRPGGISTY
jgi:hypothetical protein